MPVITSAGQPDGQRRPTGYRWTRILCKVEGSRLANHDGGLDEIIERLDSFQDALDTHLSRISKVTDALLRATQSQLQ